MGAEMEEGGVAAAPFDFVGECGIAGEAEADHFGAVDGGGD